MYTVQSVSKNLTELQFTNALDLSKVLWDGRYLNDYTSILAEREFTPVVGILGISCCHWLVHIFSISREQLLSLVSANLQ